MKKASGFVTILALVMLVLLGLVGVSMTRQARSCLDIARNFRLYATELSLAESGALSAAAMLLQEKDAAVLAQK